MTYRPWISLPVIALHCISLHAAINITSLSSSSGSPQVLGTPITWNATAIDTHGGPLTFQYSVAYGDGAFAMTRDYYPGTLSTGLWAAPPFIWQTIQGEGTYQIQVIAKDFGSGESATLTKTFVLKPLSTDGQFAISATSNPLVAIASAPPCAARSSIRLTMQAAGGTSESYSNFQPCSPQTTSSLFAAGMLPSTAYKINYQIQTGVAITNSPKAASFTTGSLPANLSFATFAAVMPPGSQSEPDDQMVLHSLLPFSATFLPVATDRGGNILWYYALPDPLQGDLLTRPLPGGNMLTIQDGNPWGSNDASLGEFLREIDLSGNIVRETNLDILLQQLVAKGARDFVPCSGVALPAAVGATCVGSLHHEAIRLANGYTAVLSDIEKIFPPFTQGDTSGLKVDVIGDGILMLDENFQVVWYFDTFEHDGGAPQLDINRPAVLGETCAMGRPGCPTMFLSGTPGVATNAEDWLHANSLDFDPSDGDLILSARHQDWVMKVDYKNGNGTGNILWRLGPGGDFTLTNGGDELFPWFSHQHDAAFANAAAGLMVLFDNGDTRASAPPIGVGGGNSAGMALTLDETNMTATLVLRQDLGYYAGALGSAQLLSNGSFFFQPGTVGPDGSSYSIEILPTSGTVNGSVIYNLQSIGLPSYRSWLLPNLYSAPASPSRRSCPETSVESYAVSNPCSNPR